MTKAKTTTVDKAAKKAAKKTSTAEQKEQKALLKQQNKERLNVLKEELRTANKKFKWVYKDYLKMERESNQLVANDFFEDRLKKYNEDVLLKKKTLEDFKDSIV